MRDFKHRKRTKAWELSEQLAADERDIAFSQFYCALFETTSRVHFHQTVSFTYGRKNSRAIKFQEQKFSPFFSDSLRLADLWYRSKTLMLIRLWKKKSLKEQCNDSVEFTRLCAKFFGEALCTVQTEWNLGANSKIIWVINWCH